MNTCKYMIGILPAENNYPQYAFVTGELTLYELDVAGKAKKVMDITDKNGNILVKPVEEKYLK